MVDLSLVLTPQGRLRIEPGGGEAEGASGPSDGAPRIAGAFERGDGHGLLWLGLAAIDTEMPAALAFWRDLGRLYTTRLCAVPELETIRDRVEIEVPREELATRAAEAPPMMGGEYLTAALLQDLWSRMEAAFRDEIGSWEGTVEGYLQRASPAWKLVGRVCLHLAENKGDEDAPFAFVATYTTRISVAAKVQHLPLGQALREYAGARNKAALLALLTPVQRAAQSSALAKDLVDSGAIFQPLAWTPDEALRFLKDVPIFEASGLVVRMPAAWHAKRPPRPDVKITIGQRTTPTFGADSMLDFAVEVTLEGETLTAREMGDILAGTDGLALIRGRWIEVDREKLRQVLDHWKAVEAARGEDGLSFIEGLRLLAGAAIEGKDGPGHVAGAPLPGSSLEWTKVVAGKSLAQSLRGLRSPEGLDAVDPGRDLHAELRPYQKIGVRWLWWLQSLGLGGCLADDMGLGKTIQVIALLVLLKRNGAKRPSLLVVPASLIANWRGELTRFAPGLRLLVAHPSELPTATLGRLPPERVDDSDVVVTTTGAIQRVAWFAERDWNLVVVDEAQAIKNPSAKQTRAVKVLRSRVRLALTGTPIENRLGDLWSLFDFICPGLLGTPKAFGRFMTAIETKSESQAHAYAPLRDLIRPYILRRLKTDPRVIADLPEKTEVRAFCGLTKKQAALYQGSVEALRAALGGADGIKRRGVVLSFLMRLKQICNHPSQWLGDGVYAPADSGKVVRLTEICEEIAGRQEKALVFTQFREMTEPLARVLAGVFGRAGLVLSGETAVKKRMGLVDQFQREDGPPFFVLSLKAGGSGLNLTAATHVIHFDRWWNPAVENQATDRAYRIGQRRNVLVHKFVCRGTVEEKIDALIESKQAFAGGILDGGGEGVLTELGDEELLRMVAIDINTALAES